MKYIHLSKIMLAYDTVLQSFLVKMPLHPTYKIFWTEFYKIYCPCVAENLFFVSSISYIQFFLEEEKNNKKK